VFLFTSILFLGGCTPTADTVEGSTDSTFRIVAYNAEWLFDGVDDPSGSPWTSPKAAQAHLEAVADVLRPLDADFVSLAEVEDAQALARLNRLLGGGYVPVFVQGTDTATGQDVAALSKAAPSRSPRRSDARVAYPVPGSLLSCGTGDSGVSKHYIADVVIDDANVTLVGVHFRAFPDQCKESAQREAQAAVIADVVRSALAQGREVVVLGDLNDYDADVPDAAGNRHDSRVLRILKDLDPAREGDELVNVCAQVPPAERYTHWYDRDRDGVDDGGRERSQIDFVLVSHTLADRVTYVAIDHTSPEGTASDHWPVVVDIATSEAIAAKEP